MADWIQAARDRFGRAGEYPLIDDTEIIEYKVVHSSWPWILLHQRDSGEELFEEALTSDQYQLPVRFA